MFVNIKSENSLMPFFAVLAAVVLWSSSFTATRIALRELSPMSVVWVRMTIGVLVVAPFALRRFPKKVSFGEVKLLVFMALLQPCLYFMLEANALRFTTASQAGVISSTVPMFVAVLSAFFLGEKTGRVAVAGLLVSVSGVGWMTYFCGGDAKASDPLLGNMLEFGAMAAAAGYMVLTRKLSSKFDPWVLTFIQTAGGAVFFAGGVTGLGAEWSTELTLALLYLGFLSVSADLGYTTGG
jgi:drug/metabolite transporter (DMT)-like permease